MIKSPCVRNCCLDNDDICLGCNRSMEEICDWTKLSDAGKEDVLRLAKERAMAREQRRRPPHLNIDKTGSRV